MAALNASRSRPNAPTATTSPISSAIAGSSQLQPSHYMPAPATTAASDTAASAIRCRKAPRRLRSCSWPPRTSHAAPRLTTIPMHRHRHHRQGGDFRRSGEAAHRLPRQCAGEGHQQQRIGQRREQRRASPAIRVAIGRCAAGEDRCTPGQPQAEHVAEVVQRVRKQRQRVGREAVAGFQRGVGEVDQRDRGEGARRVCLVVVVVARVPCRAWWHARPGGLYYSVASRPCAGTQSAAGPRRRRAGSAATDVL